MSVTTTSAPARASVRQSARPSPRDPPVTRATLPVSSNMTLARFANSRLDILAHQRTPVTGDRARDDQPLDLGGAFPDLVDLCVAHPLLDRILADVTVASQHLDGVERDLHRHVCRECLGHAALGPLEKNPVLSH